MSDKVQLTLGGVDIFPITDVSCVANLEERLANATHYMGDFTASGDGAITGGSTTLKSVAEKVGDMYIVSTAGTFAGTALEVGDSIIFKKDVAAGTAVQASDITFIEATVNVTDGNPTLAWGAQRTVGTVDGVALHATLPANPIFFATYGTTSHADILAAYNAGKDVFTLTGNVVLRMSYYNSTDNAFFFEGIVSSGAIVYTIRTQTSWSTPSSWVIEKTSNKVTSISSSSTDTEYPSAKLLYDQLALKAPLASPNLTGTPTAPTAAAGTNTTQIATTAFVQNAFGAVDAMIYKGTIAGGSTGAYGALTGAADRGWTYKVSTAGKIDGVAVEVGDMLICNTDSTAAATSSNYSTIKANWDFIQTNIYDFLWERGSVSNSIKQAGTGCAATDSGAFAHGFNTNATGTYAHAEGDGCYSNGTASHAEGEGCIADETGSHAEGHSTHAEGEYSHAEGEGTHATGASSHAEGYECQAEADYSHSEGDECYAYADYSHAEGMGTEAQATGAHSEGYQTITSGNSSHAEGFQTNAGGSYSHAEGYKTKTEVSDGWSAQGTYAHAEGRETSAIGNYSHVEGHGAQAMYECSHAEGSYSLASGYAAHAEGNSCKAYGGNSHAEGWYSESGICVIWTYYQGNNAFLLQNDGQFPTSGGRLQVGDVISLMTDMYEPKVDCSTITAITSTTITVDFVPPNLCSVDDEVMVFSTKKNLMNKAALDSGVPFSDYGGGHASGVYARAWHPGELACGCYNYTSSGNVDDWMDNGNTIFSVGIGTDESDRKNAIEVLKNGEVYIYGLGSYNGNSTTGSDLATIVGWKVEGPNSSTANHIVTFNDATGKVIKDSGYTIATSVPSGAVFTDTKVTQQNSTANSTLNVLLKYDTGTSTTTNVVNSSSSLNFNPSTGLLTTTDIRVSGNDVYVGSASGSQCHQQYDSTNKCLKFIFD